MEHRLVYDYNLRAFHQNQYIVDAHLDNSVHVAAILDYVTIMLPRVNSDDHHCIP